MNLKKRTEVKRVEVSVLKTLPSIGLLPVGLLLIAAGTLLFVSPELLYPYLASIAAIMLGMLFVVTSLTSLKKNLGTTTTFPSTSPLAAR